MGVFANSRGSPVGRGLHEPSSEPGQAGRAVHRCLPAAKGGAGLVDSRNEMCNNSPNLCPRAWPQAFPSSAARPPGLLGIVYTRGQGRRALMLERLVKAGIRQLPGVVQRMGLRELDNSGDS